MDGANSLQIPLSRLLHLLARREGVTWSRRKGIEFAGALGAGVVARYAAGFGIRQAAKLIPAYGQTIGATAAASMSFATTYALGKAAEFYLRRPGDAAPDSAGVRARWAEALKEAFDVARQRGLETGRRDAAQKDDA